MGFDFLMVEVWKVSQVARYLFATHPFYWNNYLLQEGGPLAVKDNIPDGVQEFANALFLSREVTVYLKNP